MKMESMSKNIVDVMFELTKNNGLIELLINNNNSLPLLRDGNALEKKIEDSKIRKSLIKPNSIASKISPFPFDPDAQLEDESFIRVYYNNGEFNSNEVIGESQLHIDIIVAKSLWLINDGERSLIRPYEIMGRVMDMVGKRSLNSTVRLNFEGYQHLAVNTKFDAIRLYSTYMSVET